jgi:membrane protein CcdC involved in cytochrome C biogenesis
MVILGLVIGSVGWVALFIATAAVLDRFFDAASQPSVVAVSLFWMGAGAALLISPKTRQAGAGLLMGLAIGVIVWAGLCAALLR